MDDSKPKKVGISIESDKNSLIAPLVAGPFDVGIRVTGNNNTLVGAVVTGNPFFADVAALTKQQKLVLRAALDEANNDEERASALRAHPSIWERVVSAGGSLASIAQLVISALPRG